MKHIHNKIFYVIYNGTTGIQGNICKCTHNNITIKISDYIYYVLRDRYNATVFDIWQKCTHQIIKVPDIFIKNETYP